MKSIRALFMLLLLLALPILACGGGANEEPTATAAAVEIAPTNTAEPVEPTATPAPTNTPEPTATPAPTNTPEPTATPEPTGPVIPDDFQLLESAEGGIAIYYPDGWVNADFLGLITVASDEVLLDSADPGEEGAVAVIVSDGIETDLGLPITPEDGALAVLNAILADPSILDLGTDFEVIKPAEQVDAVNEGHDVASAVAQATSENGIRVAYVLKIIITDTRFGLFLGATPVETIEQYEETLNTVGNSIALSEPTVTGEGDDTPPVSSEAVPVVLGDVIEGEMTEDLAQHDYIYTAAAGETLVVAVVPETDDQDLTLAIYATYDLEESLVDVDDGFSGEGETLSYTFDAAGDYIIRVAEFGFPDAGLFTLFIGEDAVAGALVGALEATDLVIGTTEGELPSGESEQSFTFVAAGGETLTFLLTPGNSDMDVVIEIYTLTDLDSTVAEIDSGFSGDEETLTYTFTTPGTYVIVVSEFYGEGGPYTLVVTQ
jgi:plastocyanin